VPSVLAGLDRIPQCTPRTDNLRRYALFPCCFFSPWWEGEQIEAGSRETPSMPVFASGHLLLRDRQTASWGSLMTAAATDRDASFPNVAHLMSSLLVYMFTSLAA